ncbi:MAG: hypothetical protein R3349_07725 [Geminicoccaceae bacterium]|nr:hypothetical protein [Geminicoccaceae bacterium]
MLLDEVAERQLEPGGVSDCAARTRRLDVVFNHPADPDPAVRLMQQVLSQLEGHDLGQMLVLTQR